MNAYRISSGGLNRMIYAGQPHVALNKYARSCKLKKGEGLNLTITNLGPHKHDYSNGDDAYVRHSGEYRKCPICGQPKWFSNAMLEQMALEGSNA